MRRIQPAPWTGHDPEDLGFMYSWGFVDLDGHQWGVFSMAAAPAG